MLRQKVLISIKVLEAGMEPNEQINLAKQLVQCISRATFEYNRYDPESGQNVTDTVPGTDRDELKKVFSFLVVRRDLAQFKRLVQALPASDFAGRSNKTKGYFTNIRKALEHPEINFFNLTLDDALQVLGWTCRLLPAKEDKPSSGSSSSRRRRGSNPRRR
jgi:hypothetical protein